MSSHRVRRVSGLDRGVKASNSGLAGSTPANLYDFSFLAPCPSSGLIIHGENDKICVPEETKGMAERTRTQKGRKVSFQVVPEADHFFEDHMDQFIETAEAYLDARLAHDRPEGEYHGEE